MKKGMILAVMCMCCCVAAFAQDYNEDNHFEQIAKQIKSLERLEELPYGFYIDVTEQNTNAFETKCRKVFYSAQEVYYSHKQNFNAAYNYAKVLLGSSTETEEIGLPQRNFDQARVVLQRAIKLNADDAQTYQLMDVALHHIIFGNNRWSAPHNPYWTEQRVIAQYKSMPERTAERLNAAEQRVRLKDANMLPQDYKEAALMCKALGFDKRAEEYNQKAENMTASIEVYSYQVELAKKQIADSLSQSVRHNVVHKQDNHELLDEMIDNMNKGMK